MNKNCYRIIFNRQKGQLMVVSELANRNGCVTTASSTAKTTSQSVIAKLKPLCLMVGMALGSVVVVEPAMAEIIADNTAAAHQQPQIIQQGGNNPQIVNIQAPNESGLSHNKYTQFDVDKNGAILNNSNHSTKTKLGGRIDGNANLANGQAKIILNEVNSRNPSQLNGFIEVAGQKAQVIIANPSGIACDGCGFINADKATLTTGKPQIEEGKLKGYSVTQGTISINGAGLDSRKQDYTEIIARSVEVNAGIWGNDIKVVTGRNEVSADLNTVTAYDDNNDDKPRLAVDVSALGGMYAGKIHLVGTEKGVGVNNDGRLTASKDSIVLKADGKIVNAGTIQAKDDIFIKSAQSIENTKQINSKKNVKLISRRQIVNEGSLVAQQGDIKAKARKVVLHGTNSAGQQINVKANALADLSNSNTTAKSLTVNSGNTIDVNSAALNVDNDIKLVSEESINSNNMEAKTTGNFIAQSKDIENKGATIIADKDIVLTATNTLNNELATLQTEATLNLTGNTINNDQANLEAGNDILVTSTKLTAKDASLTSGNNIKIDSAEQFDAENIKIDAKGEVNIASKGNINAKNANITTDKNLAIQADQLVLTAAEIEANDAINVNASLINNAEATWHSKGNIAVSGDNINNSGSSISSDKSITLNAIDTINNSESELFSHDDLEINAKNVNNTFANLASNTHILLSAEESINNSNTILNSKGKMQITSNNSIDNTKADISAADLFIVASNINNQEAKLTALGSGNHQGTMLIKGDLDNSKATLTSAGDMSIKSEKLNNSEAILNSKGKIQIDANSIDNTKAEITAAELGIQTVRLNNQEAKLTTLGGENYDGSMTIKGFRLDNSKATLTSAGDMNIISDGILCGPECITDQHDNLPSYIDFIDNSEATLNSKGKMQIKGSHDVHIDNTKAEINAADLTLYGKTIINKEAVLNALSGGMAITSSDIDNNEATLSSKEKMEITGNTINNTKSKITAAKLTLEADDIINQEAELTTLGGENFDGSMTITGNQLDNSKATLTSAGNMTVVADHHRNDGTDADANLNNSEATLNSKGTMQINGRDINNAKAKISAADLSLNGTTILNQEAVLNALSGDMNITSTDLNNTEATLSSKGKMLINGTTIDNTKSKITAGDLAVNANTIINQEAVLTTLGGENYEGSMTITGNQLDNSKATLTSAGNMVITTDQLNNTPDELNNSEATLISQGKMEINSYHINNEKAKISASDLKLIANTLLNKEAVLNALSSEGGITIDSDTLDNSKAILTSAGNMTIKSNQVDNNEATLNSRGNIQIDGDYIDNMKAKISAIKDLILKAKTVRNQEATLTANRIDITATDYLDNQQATLVGKEGISINTDEFDNIKAVIETEGQLDITAGNINNNKSDMYAKQIQINANKLENQDAYIRAYSQAKINADDIINSRSYIFADDLIDIVGNALTNDWKLSSNNISINLKDGLSNTDNILAKNQLSVKAKQISNEGNLVSENALTLNSDLVKNGIDGLIDAQNIQIEGDSLSNNGLINGDNVNVKLSGQFDNNDSARVFGEQVSIVANELNNKASSMAVEKAPIIAAKQSLNIDANTLNNYNHALLLSQDNMFVKATTLNNHSARIESYNDMDIMVDTLNNINDSITTEVVKVKDQVVHEFAPIASSQRYDAEDVSVVVNPDKNHRNYILKSKTGAFKDTERFNEYNYNVTGYETKITNTAPAEIVSGHNLYVNAAHVNNTSSSILAGNEVSIDEKIVNNVSTQGITRKESKGTMTYHYPIRKGIDTVNKGAQTTSYEQIDESKLDFHDAKVENNADIVKTEVAFVSHWVNITGGK